MQLNELRSRNNDQRRSVQCELLWKSRSSALNPRAAYFKILMLIGKIQVFNTRCIILILENLNYL